ncbi:helix-turn-helix domain-containing protein [Bacillus mycoides]|uniref:helix-turn-helix domain-containing protein n=1 Tax=Bacillus mycoides TaxID=1405 RepID=UPI003A80BFCC
MTFGDKLKQLRGKRTQGDIANSLNISRATYSHLENNRIEPSMTVLNALADLFCVTSDYLLGRSSDSRLTESEDKVTNDMAKRFAELVADLPEDEQENAWKQALMYVNFTKAKDND